KNAVHHGNRARSHPLTKLGERLDREQVERQGAVRGIDVDDDDVVRPWETAERTPRVLDVNANARMLRRLKGGLCGTNHGLVNLYDVDVRLVVAPGEIRRCEEAATAEDESPAR